MSNEEVTYMKEEQLESLLDKHNRPLLNFLAEMKSGGIKVNLAEPTREVAKVETKPAEKVPLAEFKGLEGAMKYEIWGIPVVAAAVGGVAAVFLTELIDGFMAKQSAQTRGIVKLVVAGAAAKFGNKLLGDTGSKAIALLIAFDALRDLVPLDTTIKNVTGKISGAVTNKGLAQTQGNLKVLSRQNTNTSLTSSQMMAMRN